MFDTVDGAAQGQRLAGLEGELLGQFVGDGEGDGDRVVAQSLDVGDLEGMEVEAS